MAIAPLARRVDDALGCILAWADRRVREKSTWTGLSMLLVALGYRSLGGRIGDIADILTMAGVLTGAGLAAATTSPHPPAPPAPADPAKTPPAPSMETVTMSVLSFVRKVLGITAVAIASSWDKAIADTFAQAEATLTPVLGDDAKKLCADAEATGQPGFTKLANVVADLAKIAADKGIKADLWVLTVIATKAAAQIKSDAPAILDTTLETAVTVAAGPTAGAIAAPIIEGAVAAATAA